MIDIPSYAEVIEYFKSQFNNNEFFIGFVCTAALSWVAFAARRVPYKIYHFLTSKFTTELVISSDDEMFPYFKRWLTQYDFSKMNKQFRLISSLNGTSYDDNRPYEISNYEEEMGVVKPPEISVTASDSTYFFRCHGKMVMVTCSKPEAVTGSGGDSKTHKTHEDMHIRYLGRSQKTTQKIIDEVLGLHTTDNKESVFIRCPDGWGSEWSIANELPPKSEGSVVLKEGQFDEIIDDIQNFIDQEEFYKRVGVPYHRGYLFYGPPGTGKTSTAYAIASHFQKPVCCLSISPSMEERSFNNLVARVPRGSLLVIEDIDCVYNKREQSTEGKSISGGVTFSAFINALDGFAAKDGAVIILTTNHPEKLDPAMVRPGRVDMRAEMTYCDTYQLKGMFEKFYLDCSEEQSTEFSRLVESDKFTPAEVQSYLMKYRDPAESLQHTEDVVALRKMEEVD